MGTPMYNTKKAYIPFMVRTVTQKGGSYSRNVVKFIRTGDSCWTTRADMVNITFTIIKMTIFVFIMIPYECRVYAVSIRNSI